MAEPVVDADAPALAASGLTVALGRRTVLSDLSFTAAPGELVGLLGPNGAGKTTLLRAMAGLLTPSAGGIRLGGADLLAMPARERARRLAYLPQAPECAWPMTAANLVALGLIPYATERAPTAAAAVTEALAATDASHLAQRPMSDLSGGERARVFLARALVGAPRMLLADEPVADLDPAHQLDIMALLQGRARAGATVVAVLHDLSLAARYCGRVVLIAGGRVLADGPPAAVLTPNVLAAGFGIRAVTGEAGGLPFVLPISRIGTGSGE